MPRPAPRRRSVSSRVLGAVLVLLAAAVLAAAVALLIATLVDSGGALSG